MAKFCKECGKELEKESKFCKNCGTKIDEEIEQANEQVSNDLSANKVYNQIYVTKKSNGMAIAGFVISLVSLLCCGCTSWLGLIFSIIGLVNANKNDGEGKGFSIAGIIISAILLALLIVLYLLGFWTAFIEGFEEGYNGVYY